MFNWVSIMRRAKDQELEKWLKLWNQDMNRGLLQLLVLAIIVDNDEKNRPPCHGYLITKKLKSLSKETIKIAAGTLYPLLHRLRDKSFIQEIESSDYERDRRNPTMYVHTADGKEYLSLMLDRWGEVSKIVDHLKNEIEGEWLSKNEGLNPNDLEK
ncbi:MAG: PadR family transcriptional regulator [Candidatus Hodarchaeales archaeon]|jgi:PadR family transcriptional regulator PadR